MRGGQCSPNSGVEKFVERPRSARGQSSRVQIRGDDEMRGNDLNGCSARCHDDVSRHDFGCNTLERDLRRERLSCLSFEADDPLRQCDQLVFFLAFGPCDAAVQPVLIIRQCQQRISHLDQPFAIGGCRRSLRVGSALRGPHSKIRCLRRFHDVLPKQPAEIPKQHAEILTCGKLRVQILA